MMLIWTSNTSVRGGGWNSSYSITVGTDEKENFAGLSVYPNPASEKLNISFSLAETQNVKIEFVSLNGVVLFHDDLASFKGEYKKSMDVSSFSPGVYLLKLTSDRGNSVRKIVVE